MAERQEALIKKIINEVSSGVHPSSQSCRIAAYPREQRCETRNMNFGGKLQTFLNCGFKIQNKISDSAVCVALEVPSQKDLESRNQRDNSKAENALKDVRRKLKIVK